MKSIKGLVTLLLGLTVAYGAARALPERSSHPKPGIESQTWLDMLELYPNIEDDEKTKPDSLFDDAEGSFLKAQIENRSEYSTADNIENHLADASNSYLNAFFYYNTENDTANARIAGINYLNTNFTFHQYQLKDYRRNAANLLKKAKTDAKTNNSKSKRFWYEAASLFKKFKDDYLGLNGKSGIEVRIGRLELEIKGKGYIGIYLSNNNPKGTWADSVRYVEDDVQALIEDYNDVNSQFNELFKLPQVQESLRSNFPNIDINIYKP